MSFSKRLGNDAVCYTKSFDSLKNWNDRFFWVDTFACPASFPWNTSKCVPKDPFPKSSEFNAEHYATLVAHPAPFHKYPEPFLCLVGISRYYTLDENTYPGFLGDDDEEMDLLSFIRTADPMKVRVAKRQRVEDEPRHLETIIGRVVPLLTVAPARASSELKASVDKLFDEGVSENGQGVDIQSVIATTDTIMEDVAPLQPRRQRKTVVADASGPSHPPKKLKEDYGALGGAFAAGKSRSMVQSLFIGALLNAEARGEPISTLPFVTSSVSATPEREDKSLADSVTGLNLRTIGAPESYCDCYYCDRNGSSSTGRTNSVPGGFSDVFGSDFLIGGIRTVVDPDSNLQKVYVPQWSLFTEFNVGAARQIYLNAKVRMHVEYNIREKRRLRSVVDEQAELLKVRDREIENLKAQLLLKVAEAAKAIQKEKNELSVKVTDLSISVKVREQEVTDLDAQVTVVKLQNDNLVDQKVVAYEDLIGQLEKFQDEKIEKVNEKFDKLCVDFVEMALHLEDKFYPHLLTTISERRWLLTHGMKLAIIRCLNLTEYLSALGAAISKAVEKGMQEGLSAGITHGAKGRKLADVAAYNPSAKADYLSALQRLQNVNFSLIAELKSNKDASVDTILNLLRLDDALAERLGLTESHPHSNQLMVPIHYSSDQRVIGASALSISLDVSHFRVRKIRENIVIHVLALRGVFVPLSVAALEGTKVTFGSDHDTTTALFVTFVSAGTIPPISTDDYEVAHVDGQEGASVDGETAAVENINPFSDVSNAELNILE
uniref:Transposase (Putative), gypsy type n=1 Tax=Tanacetum cinerariifolium TaxID=118510 RepID=A0A6L2M3Y4_TANCI|nr:transposase (putative), gypsy type [Tanacetum cinerariifolium]